MSRTLGIGVMAAGNRRPRLTLTASAGEGPVMVTRLQFDPPGVSGFFLPLRRSWLIPAETTLLLFQGPSNWPEFYMTSDVKLDQLTVLVSYIDDAGRSGEVSAVAGVVR